MFILFVNVLFYLLVFYFISECIINKKMRIIGVIFTQQSKNFGNLVIH